MSTRIGWVGLVEAIRADLARALDAVSLSWKAQDDTCGYMETKPTVEAFVYERTDADGWPHAPAILVQALSFDGEWMEMALHIAVVNSAIVDAEKAIPVDGVPGAWEYKDGGGFTAAHARCELYRACMMLCEQCDLALRRTDVADIEIEKSGMPDPALPAFPWAECTILFKARASRIPARIGTQWADLL